VFGAAKQIPEGAHEGVFELLLTLIGFAFQPGSQALASAFLGIIATGAAGHLGIGDGHTAFGSISKFQSIYSCIIVHRNTLIELTFIFAGRVV
jgi:hypothetical protein